MYSIQCFSTAFMGVNTYVVSRYSSRTLEEPASSSACDRSVDASDSAKEKDEPDCVFIVDAGGDRSDAEAYCHQLKRCDGIVFTHGHFDHTSALPFLHSLFPQAPIAIHEDDACYFGEEGAALCIEDFDKLGYSRYVKDFFEKEGFLPEATVLLKGGDVLPFAPEWTVFHTPGHSPGSICLYNKDEKTLFSGDTLFANGYFGRTDLRGGNYPLLMHSLERIKKFPFGTKVLPGHGEYTFV